MVKVKSILSYSLMTVLARVTDTVLIVLGVSAVIESVVVS